MIAESTRETAIRYATWSIACGKAALRQNPPEKEMAKHIGRGLMPVYAWKSLADTYKEKLTEHSMWELVAMDAIAAPDLYSTLWMTIAVVMERITSARRLDAAALQPHHEAQQVAPAQASDETPGRKSKGQVGQQQQQQEHPTWEPAKARAAPRRQG